jgi:hypothetical protein
VKSIKLSWQSCLINRNGNNITKERKEMDTAQACAMGAANRGRELKVFDWHKAAQIIKENNIKNASAGLQDDWEFTGGDILIDGEIPSEQHTYLASTWATPELQYEDEVIPCYIIANAQWDWGAETFWPESAQKILKEN